MLLRAWVTLQKWIEVAGLLPCYLKNTRFFRSDLELHRSRNPYAVSREYLSERGAPDIHLYGETPISTMAKIARESGLGPDDHLLELGSGRGRGAFWARLNLGCTVSGVEQIPTFVKDATKIAKNLDIDRLHFQESNITLSDYRQATVVYLFGTCLDEETIEKVIEKTRELPAGARIVSISYPLEANHLELIKSFPVRYPWGRTMAYLTSRRPLGRCGELG